MKPEDKELLLQDLCGRLPYDVKISYRCNHIHILKAIHKSGLIVIDDTITNIITTTDIENINPYLFPLSSMTEEQLYEITELFGGEIDFSSPGVIELSTFYRNKLGCVEMLAIIKWFLKNHFDIWGLIPKGLASDATELNIY